MMCCPASSEIRWISLVAASSSSTLAPAERIADALVPVHVLLRVVIDQALFFDGFLPIGMRTNDAPLQAIPRRRRGRPRSTRIPHGPRRCAPSVLTGAATP